MENRELKGFVTISEKELESVNGGWIWEVLGVTAIVVAATISIIETLRK